MNTKILIADDDLVERTALREILKTDSRWEVIEVGDGQQALDLLCDGLRPAVCLFDIRMPRMDGVELLQRMRRDPELRDLKVVITSGNRDRDVIVTLAKLQIFGYLLKPYNAEKTQAILQQVWSAERAKPALGSRNLLAKTLLLVDDDVVSRKTMLGIVSAQKGWEVVEAKDGQDALDRMQAGLRPDLGIFDLKMPRLDGCQLVQRIRDDPQLKKLRVVVISAEQDREKVKLLGQLQISGYFVKPFTPVQIQAVLREAEGITLSSSAPGSAGKAESKSPLPTAESTGSG